MDLHLLIRTLHATVLAPEIGPGMVECAEVAGRFVSPDAYLALVLPQVTGDMDANPSTDVASRHAGLILLAALLRGSHPKAVLGEARRIAEALLGAALWHAGNTSPELRSA